MRYRDLLAGGLLENTNRARTVFKTECNGHHHGQTDCTLIAYDENGDYVGKIDYAKYGDELAVQMISVLPTHQRQGYATALLKQLQREFPDREIDMGGLTPDGVRLLAAVPTVEIKNLEYQEKAEQLAKVKAQLAGYQSRADTFYQKADATEEDRQHLLSTISDWNDLSDEEWRLERELAGLRPGKRLIVTD